LQLITKSRFLYPTLLSRQNDAPCTVKNFPLKLWQDKISNRMLQKNLQCLVTFKTSLVLSPPLPSNCKGWITQRYIFTILFQLHLVSSSKVVTQNSEILSWVLKAIKELLWLWFYYGLRLAELISTWFPFGFTELSWKPLNLMQTRQR